MRKCQNMLKNVKKRRKTSKNVENLLMLRDRPTDRPTDQGVESRARD